MVEALTWIYFQASKGLFVPPVTAGVLLVAAAAAEVVRVRPDDDARCFHDDSSFY